MNTIIVAIVALSGVVWIFYAHAKAVKQNKSVAWNPTRDADSASESTQEADLIPDTQAAAVEPVDISELNRAYRIGDMHFSRGDFESAEQFFIKVLAMDKEHTDSLNRLGVMYVQQNQLKKAEMIFRQLFSITQKDPAHYANYGYCLYKQGRLSEALEAYENSIKLDANKSSRYISIGQIHYEQENHEQALVAFAKALDLDPDNLEYVKLTAELSELTGDQKRLHRSLKKWGELEPYNEEVREKLDKIS